MSFKVVAVSWPHEKELVEDHLPTAESVAVGRMTRTELGEILRTMGITRDAALGRILEQADGRPAWAVRLGSLLTDGNQWSDVLRGESVRQEVRRYLRNARISVHAYETVATVALLGGLKDTEFRALATVQGGSVQDVNTTLRKVAESGLLDATAAKFPGADRVVTYAVQPDLLAASLVANAYFSNGVAPHPLAELRAAFPERQFDIVMNTIIAELVGASHPSRPTNEQVVAALGTALQDPQKNMLRYYSALGSAEATFVLNLMLEILRASVANLERSEVNAYVKNAAMLRGDFFAELAGNSVPRIGYEASLKHFAAGAALLVEAGDDCASAVGEYFQHVRASDIGESVRVAELVKLSEAIGAMPTGTPAERTVFFEVAAQGLSPSWEANYMAPDNPRSFTLKSFLLPGGAMADVASPILTRLETVVAHIDSTAFGKLAKPLDSWVHAAAGYALPAGIRVVDDQKSAAVDVATRFANALADSALSHGSRRRLNGICKPLKVRWPEPDPLFNALAPLDDPDDLIDYEEIDYLALHEKKENEARARVVAAIAEFLDQPPAVLCARLQELQPEIRAAELRGTDQTRGVFHHLATLDTDPVPWVEAALGHELGWHALPLIEKLLRTDTVPEPLLARLLGSDIRAGVIGSALERGTGRSLKTILDGVTEADFDRQIWTSFVRVTPEALKLLNEHIDRRVAALGIACWAGWFEYVNRRDTDDNGRLKAQLAVLGDTWTDTLMSLEVPNKIDDHALERALVALARAAPAKFSELFIRHVEKERYPLNDFDEWAPAAHTLPADQKTAAWTRLNEHTCKREVFWVIAGKDTDWTEARLSDGSVPNPNELLGKFGFQRTDRPDIEDIAALFSGNADPEHILASIADPMTGDEVELAEQMLEQSQKLAESDNPNVAKIGEGGVQTWTVRLAAAKKEAREAEIRGNFWP
ncbi:hypothetical protein FB381_3315 [Nocardioides albertanoniae]|uniref:Uncharacterized protein n=2 Tax=Nocardioides albertanoniae TaxID=1175486 RepID=A0A543AA70_9ACTN|nr:hypothetical protein FB381_3315 [Nocardioides albertanoniae]